MSATQLVNPDIDRVDAVNGPATGLPFLMFKSLDNPQEAPAEEVAKSEEAPAEEAPAEEVAKSEDNADELEGSDDGIPGSKAWENVDSDTALKAARDLAALAKVVEALQDREAVEGDWDNEWDLCNAQDALSFALGILAKFALTEELESDEADAVAKAQSVIKALHLEVHEGEKPGAAPAEDAAPAAPHTEAPVKEEPKAEEPPAPAHKTTEAPLPGGLQEILDTFVESYVRFKEAQDSGPEAALAADQAENDADENTLEAPEKPEEPKAEPVAPEAPAPAEKAPEAAAPEAPAAPPAEDPKKTIAKSMDEVIAEAVAKALVTAQAQAEAAIQAATAPLLKQIDVLERTPVDSGPMLSGQTPGNGGNPFGGGQEGGVVAKGLASSPAQTAPGSGDLVNALKSVHSARY